MIRSRPHTGRVAFAIALALLISPALARAANGPIAGLDGWTATVFQEGQSSFSGLGLRARLKSAQLVDGISLMPTVEYWRIASTVKPYGIRTTRKDATLGFDARYDIPARRWKPYVGAGFGIHFISSEVNAPTLGLNDASTSVIKGGLAALAGASFGITERVGNFIELKYHHVTDYRQFKINWGLSYTW